MKFAKLILCHVIAVAALAQGVKVHGILDFRYYNDGMGNGILASPSHYILLPPIEGFRPGDISAANTNTDGAITVFSDTGVSQGTWIYERNSEGFEPVSITAFFPGVVIIKKVILTRNDGTKVFECDYQGSSCPVEISQVSDTIFRVHPERAYVYCSLDGGANWSDPIKRSAFGQYSFDSALNNPLFMLFATMSNEHLQSGCAVWPPDKPVVFADNGNAVTQKKIVIKKPNKYLNP